MKEFMFLVRGKDPVSTQEELQKRMTHYITWMQELAAKGKFKEGAPLIDNKGNLVKNSKEVVSDGSFLNPAEVISGYLIINAEDLNEATNIAKTCPLIDQFPIEVREIKVR